MSELISSNLNSQHTDTSIINRNVEVSTSQQTVVQKEPESDKAELIVGTELTPTNSQEAAPMSTSQLEKVAQQLQTFMSDMNKGLEFLVDEDSGRNVIKVIDKQSGDIVKQYPSEEVLDLVAKLSEASGMFIDSKV